MAAGVEGKPAEPADSALAEDLNTALEGKPAAQGDNRFHALVGWAAVANMNTALVAEIVAAYAVD